MTTRLTNRELSDLISKFGITDSEAKKLFESFMNSKIEDIKAEARAEAYSTMKKQVEADKKALVESMSNIMRTQIEAEKKKIDYHRNDLIKQKLALNESQNSLNKTLADKKMALKENYQKKLDEVKTNAMKIVETKINRNAESIETYKKNMAKKAAEFINESVKHEVEASRNKTLQLNTALKEFNRFMTEQVQKCIKEHREEMKNLDELKVRTLNESNKKLADAKSSFKKDMASKVAQFVQEQVSNEIHTFRKEIKNNRKDAFGRRLYEAFYKEFMHQFINENKFMNELAKSSTKRQKQYQQVAEAAQQKVAKLEAQVKALNETKDAAVREKIIVESAMNLPEAKRTMLRSLVKSVPTEQLKAKISSFIPMIMKENSTKTINTDRNEKMLNESKNRVVTGDSKKTVKPIAQSSFDDDEVINELINL